MKFRSLFLSAVAALLITSVASAQFSPLSLTSEGTFSVTSMPFGPPQAHGVGLGTTPGYGALDIWCTDYAGSLHVGHSYTASFTSLAAGGAALDARTVHGSAGLTGYLKAAFLYSYLKTATDAADSETARDIHYAIWHFLTPGSPFLGRPGEVAWATLADNNYGNVGNGRWFFVVTDNDRSDDGRHQEFLTYATPEPGTYALLATGLVGLSFAGLRRRKKDVA